ncbi:MAG: hypothetical protein ACOX60_06275 [Massiliimalia sp.]|jgi:hypothetical protein
MTRKRFKKLMMAKGYSRNQANSLCLFITQYKDYSSMYNDFMFYTPEHWNSIVNYGVDVITKFREAIVEFCNNTLPKMIDSLANKIQKLNEQLNYKMEE